MSNKKTKYLIAGAAGVGKTNLAASLANSIPDGWKLVHETNILNAQRQMIGLRHWPDPTPPSLAQGEPNRLERFKVVSVAAARHEEIEVVCLAGEDHYRANGELDSEATLRLVGDVTSPLLVINPFTSLELAPTALAEFVITVSSKTARSLEQSLDLAIPTLFKRNLILAKRAKPSNDQQDIAAKEGQGNVVKRTVVHTAYARLEARLRDARLTRDSSASAGFCANGSDGSPLSPEDAQNIVDAVKDVGLACALACHVDRQVAGEFAKLYRHPILLGTRLEVARYASIPLNVGPIVQGIVRGLALPATTPFLWVQLDDIEIQHGFDRAQILNPLPSLPPTQSIAGVWELLLTRHQEAISTGQGIETRRRFRLFDSWNGNGHSPAPKSAARI